MKLVNAMRLIDPGDLYHSYGKPLQLRLFLKNGISLSLTLGKVVKYSTSSSTKSTRDTSHESYKA